MLHCVSRLLQQLEDITNFYKRLGRTGEESYVLFHRLFATVRDKIVDYMDLWSYCVQPVLRALVLQKV